MNLLPGGKEVWGINSDIESRKSRIFKERNNNTIGILSWDGFTGSVSLGSEILDGDSSFRLKILLSDDSVISASGYNTAPVNADDVFFLLTDFFPLHTDYSAYFPREFPDCAVISLVIELNHYMGYNKSPSFELELRRDRKEWMVNLDDPQGEILEAGTKISEYGYTEEELPFDDI